MKDLIEFAVENIVEDPTSIKIETSKEEGSDVIKLSVAEKDIPIIIGKRGKMIKALRTLLKIRALREGKRAYLELVQANGQNPL